MVNERKEMLENSTTLYFGPWYRKSPFFEATRRAGCTAYDIYNHMYIPAYYDDVETEYWALLNDVTIGAGCEGQGRDGVAPGRSDTRHQVLLDGANGARWHPDRHQPYRMDGGCGVRDLPLRPD